MTYYCLHCKALNTPKPPGERAPVHDMLTNTSTRTKEDADVVASAGLPYIDPVPANDRPVAANAGMCDS